MGRLVLGGGVVSAARRENGTSMLEVLVALVLIAMGALSVAPMFVSSANANASGADISSLTAVATAQMESLRATAFHNLIPGGSLTSDLADYSDTTDPDAVLRWEIIDGGGPTDTKTIRLIAFAMRQLSGPRKSVELSTQRSR